LFLFLFSSFSIILSLFSSSSSGIASLLVLYIIIGYLFITKKKFEERIIWFILVLLVILILVLGVYFLFTDIIESAILNKGDTASKLERSLSIESAWNNFLEYPLFGVGWGSVTSFDLFVRVLSNTGIIGGIIFIIFIFKIIKTHLNQRKLSNNYLSVKNINPAVITSFIVIIFNNAVSGFTFQFGHIWFVFGLSYVTYFRKNRIK
jgi:O-antigen ligase